MKAIEVYSDREHGITLRSYDKEVERLMAPGTDLNCCVLGIVGEAGEVADQWKKQQYNGFPENLDKLDEEVGDVLWYIQAYCLLRNTTITDLMCENMTKLNERYPNGFVPGGGVRKDE